MDSKSDSLDHWRKYFQTSKSDIFDIIEQAIRVAAADHPEEFKRRRERFAEHLLIFKLRRSSKKEEKSSSDSGNDSKKSETVALTVSSVVDSSDSMKNPCFITVVDEEEKLRATMENSKKRLREGYQRAENLKKLRRIQVMDLKDLQKQGLGNHKTKIAFRGR